MPKAVSYRPIPGFPAYRVGDDGSIWSCWRRTLVTLNGRLVGTKCSADGFSWFRLKPGYSSNGKYEKVDLRRDGRYFTRRVNRLVLEAFVGPCPDGCESLHGDGDSLNNRLKNLRWGSKRENALDSVRHGTHFDNRGEKHPNARLTKTEVLEMRRLKKEGATYRSVADKFGVCIAQAFRIINAQQWASIS